jgi:hypothetical protein
MTEGVQENSGLVADAEPRKKCWEGGAGMTRWGVRFMIVGLVAVGLTGTMRSDSAEFHEGQMFPTLIFPSLDGSRPGSVADFRGKKLILHIFASW